jgi:hypothetical protein
MEWWRTYHSIIPFPSAAPITKLRHYRQRCGDQGFIQSRKRLILAFGARSKLKTAQVLRRCRGLTIPLEVC